MLEAHGSTIHRVFIDTGTRGTRDLSIGCFSFWKRVHLANDLRSNQSHNLSVQFNHKISKLLSVSTLILKLRRLSAFSDYRSFACFSLLQSISCVWAWSQEKFFAPAQDRKLCNFSLIFMCNWGVSCFPHHGILQRSVYCVCSSWKEVALQKMATALVEQIMTDFIACIDFFLTSNFGLISGEIDRKLSSDRRTWQGSSCMKMLMSWFNRCYFF